MARKGDAIYKRGKAWWLDFKHQGKRHQVSLGRSITRSAALDIAVRKRSAILSGEAGIGKKRKDFSFDKAKEDFLAWAQANKRPGTVRGYVSIMNILGGFFGGKKLSEIHPFLIEKYKQKRLAEGAKVAVNRELSRLRTLFNLCLAWKKFEGENPARRFARAPESRGRVRYLTLEEEQKLLEAAEEPLRSLIMIGIHTGLRIQSEGLSLTWANVNFSQQSITVEDHFAKNGETRTIPLNSVALATLKALKARIPGPQVFMTRKGSKRRGDLRWEAYKSFKTAFATACWRVNLADVTPHVLRHTFASRLVMRGADLRTVQELGGWKSLAMVQRYAHLSQEHKRQAVELLAENSPTVITTVTREEGSETAVNSNVVNMMGR
jgi:integrase